MKKIKHYFLKKLGVQFHIDSLSAQSDLIKNSKKEWPLISIIMPTWNRAEFVIEAIQSVITQTYPYWELLIVDDGSTDQTQKIISKHFKNESRIRYYYQNHFGVSAARNFALEKSKGNIIAYLDSDNVYSPTILFAIADAFLSHPEWDALYFGAIWKNYKDNTRSVYFPEHFNFDDIIIHKKDDPTVGIDLNCFSHRKKMYENCGGFDAQLTRLVDYDLIYRYQKQTLIHPIHTVGVHYRMHLAKNTITAKQNLWHNLYQIREKFKNPTQKKPLRVLYVIDHFPQISESYVYQEIDYMQRNNVHIEVWSSGEPTSPYSTDVPVHYGNLSDAIKKSQPDLVHAHWLNIGINYVNEIYEAGLPMTVRGHGFEFSIDHLEKLNHHSTVHHIYSYPHFQQKVAHLKKIKPLSSCFNPHFYFPTQNKDKKLIVRVAAGLRSKDLYSFINIAKQCKKHRFVLAVVRCTGDAGRHVDEIIQYNKQQGNPVELYINKLPAEAAALVREAGIYFHTHLPVDRGGAPFGMPISIAESMATGAYVIGRYCEPFENYIGNAGKTYKSENEAIKLIHETLHWSNQQWHDAQQKSIDRAYQYYLDDRVLPTLLNDWLTIAI